MSTPHYEYTAVFLTLRPPDPQAKLIVLPAGIFGSHVEAMQLLNAIGLSSAIVARTACGWEVNEGWNTRHEVVADNDAILQADKEAFTESFKQALVIATHHITGHIIHDDDLGILSWVTRFNLVQESDIDGLARDVETEDAVVGDAAVGVFGEQPAEPHLSEDTESNPSIASNAPRSSLEE